jgi:predicted Ser/Thr protein kinase
MATEAELGAGATLGGHEILYQLKAGGMGQVLLARQRGPRGFERLVAVKTIRSELRGHDPLRRMFLDEAQLLARLSHPSIAQIYDFGEDEGVLYLAMEYVAGVRFRDLVAMSIPPAVSARAMAEVCRALHVAHELSDLAGSPLGVVHRDVSPDNLMLTFDGQVKVLDFGIALMRGRQAPVTEFGTIKGKPPYLSPEQVKNQVVDRRTDVFASAVVLHELLTGVQLFDGDSVYAIARAIEHDEVAPPSSAAGRLPAGLDAAVMRGLERDPERRWQSTAELASALDQVVGADGGESLAEYAERQLGGARKLHRDWLRGVLEGKRAETDRGRPSGIITAPAAAEVFDPDGPTLDTGTRGARSRRRLVVAFGAAVAVIAALLLLGPAIDRQSGEASRTALAREAPDAGVAVVAPVADAGAAPHDAAVEVARTPPPRPSRTRSRRSAQPSRPKPVARPPVAPAPVGTGTITVVTRPGGAFASVRIDGDHHGPTPILGQEIAAGDHVVEFLHPGTNQVRERRKVRVEPGQHLRVEAR